MRIRTRKAYSLSDAQEKSSELSKGKKDMWGSYIGMVIEMDVEVTLDVNGGNNW